MSFHTLKVVLKPATAFNRSFSYKFMSTIKERAGKGVKPGGGVLNICLDSLGSCFAYLASSCDCYR